jgi:hypothetical protein
MTPNIRISLSAIDEYVGDGNPRLTTSLRKKLSPLDLRDYADRYTFVVWRSPAETSEVFCSGNGYKHLDRYTGRVTPLMLDDQHNEYVPWSRHRSAMIRIARDPENSDVIMREAFDYDWLSLTDRHAQPDAPDMIYSNGHFLFGRKPQFLHVVGVTQEVDAHA